MSQTPSLRLHLIVAFSALLLIGANDGGFGVLLPSIGAHYQATTATLGILFIAITIGYAAVAFTSGLLMEKFRLGRFLLFGATCFVLSEFLTSRLPPFPAVFLTFLLLGCAIAFLDVGSNAFIAGLPGRTVRLNDLHAFYGAGALLGPVIASGALALGQPWNAVYLFWALLGVVLVVSLALVMRSQVRYASPSPAPLAPPAPTLDRNVLFSAMRIPLLWLGALFLIFYVGIEVSLGSWSYTFLTEGRGGSPLLMGWVISGYWISFTLGRFTLARLARRINDVHLIRWCLASASVGLLLTWLVPASGGAAIGLWLTGLSLGPIYPTTIAVLPRLVSSRLLVSAIGVIASLGSLGGAIFPWLAGTLLHVAGPGVLPTFALALTIIMLAFWIALSAGARAVPD